MFDDYSLNHKYNILSENCNHATKAMILKICSSPRALTPQGEPIAKNPKHLDQKHLIPSRIQRAIKVSRVGTLGLLDMGLWALRKNGVEIDRLIVNSTQKKKQKKQRKRN